MKTSTLVVVAVVVVAVAAAGALFLPNVLNPPRQLEEVTFILDWIIYGKHVMYYPAIDQGIYEKYGLKVNIVRGYGSGDTIQKINAKQGEFGFADLGSLVILRSQGAKVVMVGMVHHVMPHTIAYVKGKSINTPKDLEGKTMSTPAGNAVWVLFPAFARAVGIDPAKVNFVPADVPVARAALLSGQVDMTGMFWGEKGALDTEAAKLGIQLGYFRYSDYGLDLYSNGIIVHEDLLREKPDLVERFIKATFEGIWWSLKNPDQSLDIYMKYNPEQVKEVARLEWIYGGIDMYGDIPKMAKNPLQLGWMDPNKVKRTVDVISQFYQLQRPVTPDELYTNRFVERTGS
ncbi:MAG: ABC transporter substrate-binding protein [Candidatus Caldarchaeum sp.]